MWCYDIVWAKFRSKLDITEAYEQMCIRPEDVCKMTFSTIFSTFQSWVMQMGDCNAPSTFQQLMTTIFQEFLRRSVYVYLDNIFISSQSIREHIEHIMKVLQWLKESQFYLSNPKPDLFSDKTDCLGYALKPSQSFANSDLGHLQHFSDSNCLPVLEMPQSTSYPESLPAVPNTTVRSLHSNPSSDTPSEDCSETSTSSKGSLETSSNSIPSDPNSTPMFLGDSSSCSRDRAAPVASDIKGRVVKVIHDIKGWG